MRSIKSVLVALVAVLALGAVAASGASAHEYFIEGKSMKELGLQEETVTATSSGNITLSSGTVATVSCISGGKAGGGTIKVGGAGVMTVEVTECHVEGLPNCKVHPIIMHNTVDGLVEMGGQLSDEFLPEKTGGALFEMEIVNGGGECSVSGLYEFRGRIVGRVTSETDGEVVTLSFTSTSGTELESFTARWGFKFTDKLKLSGANKGKKWSARK